MKREWKYLAALLPYTMAISSSMAFGAAVDDWNSDAMRHKGKASQEEENSPDGQDGSGGQESHDGSGAKTPGDASSALDAAYAPDGGGYDGSDVGSSIASVPHISGDMYAPPGAGPGAGHAMFAGFGGGGGFSVIGTVKTVLINGSPENNPLTEPGSSGGHLPDDGLLDDASTDNVGIVVPDPTDADAMMILLGGLAEGTGEGATSSGDVVFDIVDYGTITFGYGYATFMASGADGAYADSYFDVEGADLFFSYGTGPSYGPSAYSTTHVLAIDFEDETIFTEQQLAGFDWMKLLAEGPFAQNILGPEEDVSVDGNIALMDMFSEVSHSFTPAMGSGITLTFNNVGSVVSTSIQGQHTSLSLGGEAESIDSLASASGALLEIEDQYSSVNGVIIGIG